MLRNAKYDWPLSYAILTRLLRHFAVYGKNMVRDLKLVNLFLFTVKSFVSLTKDLLQVNGVEYILSEKFCQDPVEEFFGKVRGFHGHNNHPTVQQFESALAHITILKGKDMLATTRGNITRSEQDATIIDTPLPKRY